ncbi:MAG: hypothetical protein H6590_09130 [Flavobacteriales bacterium]|nr:hypothetical protein [Flavobacteriales bacterium]
MNPSRIFGDTSQTYATKPTAAKANQEKTPNPMMHHYRTTPLIVTILLLSTLAIKISTWVQGHGWEHHGWTGGISVVSVIGGFLALHDRYLWRLPVFNLLVNVPMVRGEYEGKVSYNYEGEDRTKRVRAVIAQRATHISVCCSFAAEVDRPKEETMSRSIHADLLDRDGHGRWQLCMLYHNEGERTTGSSGAHDGFAALDLDADTGILKGFYFNGRKRIGTMELVPLKKK